MVEKAFSLERPKNLLKRFGLFGWNYWYLIWRPWVFFRECYDHTKWFIQRGWRGYADRDAWGIETYLNSWMPQVMRRLEKVRGHPIDLCGDAHSSLGCTHSDDHLKEWHAVIKKVRNGFRAARLLEGHGCFAFRHTKMRAWLVQKQEEGLGLFAKHYGSFWD